MNLELYASEKKDNRGLRQTFYKTEREMGHATNIIGKGLIVEVPIFGYGKYYKMEIPRRELGRDGVVIDKETYLIVERELK